MKIVVEQKKFQEALEILAQIEEKQKKIYGAENLYAQSKVILQNIEIYSWMEVQDEVKIRDNI
jgi:hypothetical protein